jgi:hypothetical protein
MTASQRDHGENTCAHPIDLCCTWRWCGRARRRACHGGAGVHVAVVDVAGGLVMRGQTVVVSGTDFCGWARPVPRGAVVMRRGSLLIRGCGPCTARGAQRRVTRSAPEPAARTGTPASATWARDTNSAKSLGVSDPTQQHRVRGGARAADEIATPIVEKPQWIRAVRRSESEGSPPRGWTQRDGPRRAERQVRWWRDGRPGRRTVQVRTTYVRTCCAVADAARQESAGLPCTPTPARPLPAESSAAGCGASCTASSRALRCSAAGRDSHLRQLARERDRHRPTLVTGAVRELTGARWWPRWTASDPQPALRASRGPPPLARRGEDTPPRYADWSAWPARPPQSTCARWRPRACRCMWGAMRALPLVVPGFATHERAGAAGAGVRRLTLKRAPSRHPPLRPRSCGCGPRLRRPCARHSGEPWMLWTRSSRMTYGTPQYRRGRSQRLLLDRCRLDRLLARVGSHGDTEHRDKSSLVALCLRVSRPFWDDAFSRAVTGERGPGGLLCGRTGWDRGMGGALRNASGDCRPAAIPEIRIHRIAAPRRKVLPAGTAQTLRPPQRQPDVAAGEFVSRSTGLLGRRKSRPPGHPGHVRRA